MKIKIGDQVRFLNDSGEGKVVRLLQNNLVEVRTPDGWDIPYPVQELVVLPSSEGGEAYVPEPFEEKKEIVEPGQMKGQENTGKNISSDVFLLIVQDREAGNFSGIRLYLVNDSSKDLSFIYYRIGLEKTNVEENDSLEPGTKIFLDELNLEVLSSIKGWQLQGILSQEGQDHISPVINHFVPFQTKKFASAGAYSENDFLHEPSMVIALAQEKPVLESPVEDIPDLNKIIAQKESGNVQLNKPRVFQTNKPESPPREVDLHINHLIDKVIGLSNREIIGIQMEAFHRELNLAISSNERSIVFIHGIGNGTLKKELHKSVEREYSICEFEDASFKEYGFGATLIKIRQNK